MVDLFGFGHEITSDLPIPGTLPDCDRLSEPAPQLSIVLAPPARIPSSPIYRIDSDALMFNPPGVGQYRCLSDRIEVTPETGGDGQALVDLLIATALPAVQWLRGHFVLHAAGVVLPGSSAVIAICGLSGSGKSTLAAALLLRGASLLGDDSLRLASTPAGWTAAGLPGGLFEISPAGGERSFRPAGPGRMVGEARLDAIFVLGERGSEFAIERFDRISAVGQLLAMRHRPRIPALVGRSAQVLEQATGLATALPLFGWQRVTGEAALGDQEFAMLLQCCGQPG